MREGERRDGNYLKESNKSTAGLTRKGNPVKKESRLDQSGRLSQFPITLFTLSKDIGTKLRLNLTQVMAKIDLYKANVDASEVFFCTFLSISISDDDDGGKELRHRSF